MDTVLENRGHNGLFHCDKLRCFPGNECDKYLTYLHIHRPRSLIGSDESFLAIVRSGFLQQQQPMVQFLFKFLVLQKPLLCAVCYFVPTYVSKDSFTKDMIRGVDSCFKVT